MKIFKAEDSKKDQKLVGVYLKSRYHSYLSLYTLAKKTNKTAILKELIVGWVDQERKNTPDQALIDAISKRIRDQWNVYIEKKPHSNIDRFKIEVEKELMEKGIDENYITLITKILN